MEVINTDQEVGTSPFMFTLVQLLEDDLAEPPETFTLVLSATSGAVSVDAASSTTTVTIRDNDSELNYV